MGRKPLPAELKRLRGNPGKRPLRDVPGLGPAPIGNPPPAHLGKDGRAEWFRITVELRDAGLLDRLDSTLIECWCSAYSDFVGASRALRRSGVIKRDRDGNHRRSPWLMVKNRAVQELQRIAGEFGMTPSARARLGQPIRRNRTEEPKPETEGERIPTLREFIAQGTRMRQIH